MLFQPSDITPDVLNGTGCVDATAAWKLSWLLGGTSPLAAWQADIYEGTTLVRTTGKITLASPLWPLDPEGTPRRFESTLNSESNQKANEKITANLINGHEYRLFISQWDSAGTKTSQTTPSVFLCRSAPVLALSAPATLAARKTEITATYTQAQGDAIASLRWMAYAGDTLLSDSGEITGAAELRLKLDGLLPDTTCRVTLSVTTEAGAGAAAEASFPVSYSLSPGRGGGTALCREGLGCILVSWTRYAAATSYSVFRRQGQAAALEKVAECPATTGSLRDYGVLAGSTYTYYVYPSGEAAYLALPVVSDAVTAALTAFRLVEGEEGSDGVFVPSKVHLFTCSDGDPVPGGVTGNLSPSVRPGLSRYPVLLPSPSDYRSGTLTGYVSSSLPFPAGSGTASSLSELSSSLAQHELVLLTPSGEKYRVSLAGPVTELINYKSARMPRSLRIPWVETGTAPVAVTTQISSGFIPQDGIIFSGFTLDPATGCIIETSNLVPHSSQVMTILSISTNGCLLAAEPASPTPAAAVALDASGALTATVSGPSAAQ